MSLKLYGVKLKTPVQKYPFLPSLPRINFDYSLMLNAVLLGLLFGDGDAFLSKRRAREQCSGREIALPDDVSLHRGVSLPVSINPGCCWCFSVVILGTHLESQLAGTMGRGSVKPFWRSRLDGACA